MGLPYDDTNPEAIEQYAKRLINQTFKQILEQNPDFASFSGKGKGRLGQLLEKYYFQYELNSDSDPDFPKAGVELKTTAYEETKRGKLRAKERLVLNIINYMEVHKETFESSSFLKKNALLLLIFYFYPPNGREMDHLDFFIKYAQLFEFPEKDRKIIEDDWNKIVQKVRDGKAHEISESDTNYLSACTKGKNKESMRNQPFSYERAKQRAFSLKPSYMTHIFNEYILEKKPTYKYSIVKDSDELNNLSFDELIISKIHQYKGMTIHELEEHFNIQVNKKAKSYLATLSNKIIYKILGGETESFEEFQKANIKIKTIRLNKNNTITESMSFPAFDYKELVEEEWETSTLREMFINQRFLFVIFKFNNAGDLQLYKAKLWSIPEKDLEDHVKWVWEETVNRIKEEKAEYLPGIKDNPVAHVRPHGRNAQDTSETHYGVHLPKKSFWLTNRYILQQIMEDEE